MNIQMKSMLQMAAICALLVAYPMSVQAEGPIKGEGLSSDEIVNVLFKNKSADAVPANAAQDETAAPVKQPHKTRSIQCDICAGPAQAKKVPEPTKHALNKAVAATQASSQSIAFGLRFDYDSDRLTESSRTQLQAMVKALMSPESGDKRVLIEGHTDAAGPADYNQELSMKRAQAVKEFLVENGLSEQRLITVGLGKTRPLPGVDPMAAENRRVEFKPYQ